MNIHLFMCIFSVAAFDLKLLLFHYVTYVQNE
jgi:hypothetical protein